MRSTRLALVLSAAAVLAAAGCSSTSDPADPGASGDRPVVVTDMYPTTFAVQSVAGDAVDIVQLAPPGVEPHDYELTPKQVQQIADADLVAYLPGMIPAVADAVEQEAAGRSVDVSTGVTLLAAHEHSEEAGEEHDHEHVDGDPHIWLSPANMAVMGRNVATALTGAGIPADAGALDTQMATLQSEMTSALSSCAVDTLVVSHEAFGYLADMLGFTQVGISGISPDAEPSPATMAEIADLVKQKGITTIYHEALLSPAAAEAIASETGAASALLDPIEGNTDEAGYPAIMRANTETLRTGQTCS